jgi:hypothetical protein
MLLGVPFDIKPVWRNETLSKLTGDHNVALDYYVDSSCSRAKLVISFKL